MGVAISFTQMPLIRVCLNLDKLKIKKEKLKEAIQRLSTK